MLASCSQHRESFISDHRADIRLLAGSSGLGSSQLATSVLGAELRVSLLWPGPSYPIDLLLVLQLSPFAATVVSNLPV